ncbi:serpin family protein [Kitasatospora sp. NPDC056731]|uniref:serpin family protein n=1 Tax=Kitasatospora sp. NPDC056731 TaxID=3155422 RepID=UPI003422E3F2
MGRAEAVRAVNGLGARWVEQAPAAHGTVLMPAGVWPLLGLLAPAGSPAVRGELEEALGMRAEAAAVCAGELLGLLRGLPGVGAALGLWSADRLRLRPEWSAALPTDVHGRLSGDTVEDRRALDAWAARCTDGLIDAMPVGLDPDTRLVLAAALTVRTDWIRPFDEGAGPELGDEWGGPVTYLSRWTSLLDRAAVLETPTGPVTELRVLGHGDIDVRLLLGEPDAPAGRVLAAGIGALSHPRRRITADRLPTGSAGPGLTLGWRRSHEPQPELCVHVPRFTVKAEHDLLARPELFGLATASTLSPVEHRLPGLSDGEPLFVQGAAQTATATFGPRGFRAASVTAVSAAATGAPPPPPYRIRYVEVCFARPFGFLAAHRDTGLVLAAGWVTEPDPRVD